MRPLPSFLFAAITAWVCTAALAQAPAASWTAAQIAEATLGELPGVISVGVLRGDKVDIAIRRRERVGARLEAIDAAQPAAEPIFEIGSVSKVFTGLLVARRVQQGQLRLDDTLGGLLQGRVPFRYEAASAIQVGQLLTHTSCLQRWPASFTRDGVFQQATAYGRERLWGDMSALVLGRSAPCETRYSNVGYAVLGQLLADRAQRPWESLVIDEIARPAGLPDTRYQLSAAQQGRVAPPWRGAHRSARWDAGVFAPAGGLHSTATDLLAFSRALMQGRAGPLGPAVERLVTPLAAFGDDDMRIGHGVFLSQAPARIWLHNGETHAYNAEWVVWPDTREALVILASNKEAPTRRVRREIVAGTWAGTVQDVVYTQGEFRGTFEEGADRLYVRVKVAPGWKLPFSTLTFRLRDRQLVAGLAAGTAIEFRADRIEGENTLVAVRPRAP